MSSCLSTPRDSIPSVWNDALLDDCGLPRIQSNDDSRGEKEVSHGTSSHRFHSQTTSSRLFTKHDRASNSSEPLSSKLPFNFYQVNHSHMDYVPENVPVKISWLDIGRNSARDMYQPIIRSYPYPYGREPQSSHGLAYSRQTPFIEHIDVSTVWKGISLADAKTLFHIHEAFQASLELLFRDALRRLCQDFRQECMSYRPDPPGELGDLTITRKLKFSQSQLSHTMLRMSSARGEQLKSRKNQRFAVLLPFYLTTCDYLMKTNGDIYQDTAIEVCTRYEEPRYLTIPPRIVIEAAWVPDLLSFDHVRKTYSEGNEIIIIPHYCRNSAYTPQISQENVQYSLGSSQEWLKWDENISGFRGAVPLYSELRGVEDKRFGKAYEYHDDGPYTMANRIHVEIKALLTGHFAPSHRLERTIRARLTFKIMPWYKSVSAGELKNSFAKRFTSPPPDGLLSPISSQKSSRSRKSFGKRDGLRDVSNGCDDKWKCSGSYPQKQPEAMDLQIPKTKSQAELCIGQDGQPVSRFKLASITKKYEESNDVSSISTIPRSCNDEILDYRNESKTDSLLHLGSQAERILDFIENVSETSQLPCSSSISSLGGFRLDNSSEGERDRDSSLLPSKMDGIVSSRSQTGWETYTRPFSQSGTSMYPEDKTHVDNQGETFYKSHKRHMEAISFDAESAGMELIKQSEPLWPQLSEMAISKTTGINTPPDSVTAVNQFTSEHSRSCSNSSSLEFVVENPDLDPKIRREQAILWKVLSAKESRITAKLSMTERKDIYDAMKESVEEEERRKNAQTEAIDVLDDVFLTEGNNTDDGEDTLSNLGMSEMSSNISSSLESGDRELAGAVNYGF